MKYKFWDSGYNAVKKYNYIAEAANVEPRAMIFVFSLTDRDSFEEVQRQVDSLVLYYLHL